MLADHGAAEQPTRSVPGVSASLLGPAQRHHRLLARPTRAWTRASTLASNTTLVPVAYRNPSRANPAEESKQLLY